MVWINWGIFTDRWLQRAKRGRVFIDDGDRFISLWIAFNGWMRGKFGELLRATITKSVKSSGQNRRIYPIRLTGLALLTKSIT